MPPLTPERWRALSPYLDEALEIGNDQRAAWLASLDARDAALAADLRTLLDEQQTVHDSGFLEGAVLSQSAPQSHLMSGQVLGAYKLVSPIGQGGMGSVWLAERCDGRFQGRAAVKLLNIALVGRAGEERFKREGTLLARVRHPRIAHLIDAGVSPIGQPYLVLEHVDGDSIDRYCDEHALNVHARLRLFLDVLDAIGHAHASLVVHRDIKPANVLVSRDGQVKLLDFGIAKLLERDVAWDAAAISNISPLTREPGTALTPAYSAPEQLAGGPVTTATDVYALGVLLFVLLTGEHPAGDASHSAATLMRAIVDTDPRHASQAIEAEAASGSAGRRARERGTTPARLERLLRGDLDAIVARALKKNPAERYASVTAMADDIKRYLRREPIGARSNSVGYRFSKFVRRHAAGVAAAIAVVLVMAALVTVYTIRVSAERDRAQREAAKAVKVSELLMGLLTSADPFANRTSREELTVRGLLDASAGQVQRELAGQPELQAEILTMMGRTYRRLGVFGKAQALLQQALASGQQAYGAEHPRIAETLQHLGVVLADTGDYAAAAPMLERALAMRRRLLGAEHADVAISLVELGRVYQDQGANDRAEPLQREALAVRRNVLGDEHPETAVSLSDLASVLRLNGDLEAAESLLQQCLELNRRTRGEGHPNTSTTLHDLALITAAKGNTRAAESIFREVLAQQRRSLGDRHPIIATTLNNLARVIAAQGRTDEAAASQREALDIARAALGPDHQLLGIYAVNGGAIELARNRPELAEPLLREGLRIRTLAPGIVPVRRRTFPEDDRSPGAVKSLLGAALVRLGRYEEAETTLLDAQRDLSARPGPQARELDENRRHLITLYERWGKPDQAAALRSSSGS